MIDFNFENTNKPKSGTILISEPFIEDKYFTRSVIFLCDHGDEGSFGFVLNNYIETSLQEMIADFPDIDVRVSLGGPVDSSNLFFIHTLPDLIPNSQEIAEGMYIGGNFADVVSLLKKQPKEITNFRFFVGYSGWDANQLEAELKEKSWIVLPKVANKHILDSHNDDLWKDLMDRLGGKFKVMSTFPKNPSHN